MSTERYWAVIPAAGSGSRIGSEVPKQYLPLCGRAVLEHTLTCFCDHPDIEGVVVVVARGDKLWPKLDYSRHRKIRRTDGGSERVHSVLNGLEALAVEAAATDWILVHDAARPCIRASDIDRLIAEVGNDAAGGLLAWPVRDTLKRSDAEGNSEVTVDRSGLWHALTPQMFRLTDLRSAIRQTLARGMVVTDEAQAMELCGFRPRLVHGSPDNIKITLKADLAMAELFLQAQADERLCV